MTQEQKDLLLKDLCARLPYGVKVHRLGNHKHSLYKPEVIDVVNYEICMKSQGPYMDNSPFMTKYAEIEEVKPYLFPLSSMTEEQKKEFLSAAGYEIREEDCGRHTETYYYDLVGHEHDLYPNTEAIDWCRKNHFDIYGLIPMDLAIDATNKNIY